MYSQNEAPPSYAEAMGWNGKPSLVEQYGESPGLIPIGTAPQPSADNHSHNEFPSLCDPPPTVYLDDTVGLVQNEILIRYSPHGQALCRATIGCTPAGEKWVNVVDSISGTRLLTLKSDTSVPVRVRNFDIYHCDTKLGTSTSIELNLIDKLVNYVNNVEYDLRMPNLDSLNVEFSRRGQQISLAMLNVTVHEHDLAGGRYYANYTGSLGFNNSQFLSTVEKWLFIGTSLSYIVQYKEDYIKAEREDFSKNDCCRII